MRNADAFEVAYDLLSRWPGCRTFPYSSVGVQLLCEVFSPFRSRDWFTRLDCLVRDPVGRIAEPVQLTDHRTGVVMFDGGFTVLMAVYGRDDPELFQRAIDSVYGNTVTPDDFVLVVDGPVPPVLDEAIRQCTNNRPIRTVRLPRNLGLANALNEGLRAIRTTWVVRADADDVNVPYRFERQADAIQRVASHIDLLGGAILEVDRAGSPVARREVPLGHAAIVGRLHTRNPFNHMTVAYRTARVLDAGGYPNIHLKEDYGLWAAMIARGARCSNVMDVLVNASAGPDMHRRRGGFLHAKSEFDLQLHLYRLGHKSLWSAVSHGLARAAVSLLPAALRAWVYYRYFRQQPSSPARVAADPHSSD